MLPKGDPANQFKPVVPWPHVEGVEVDLNSIRLKHGETSASFSSFSLIELFLEVTAANHRPIDTLSLSLTLSPKRSILAPIDLLLFLSIPIIPKENLKFSFFFFGNTVKKLSSDRSSC